MRDAQIVDRIGAEVQAGALTLVENSFHPQSQSGLFAGAFGDCWGYGSTHADFVIAESGIIFAAQAN